MSRKVNIDSIEYEHREQIMKDLQIKIEGSTYVHNSKPSYIYPLDICGDNAYIPFAYGRICPGGPFIRPERDSYGKLTCRFAGSLRPQQREIKKEAIITFK